MAEILDAATVDACKEHLQRLPPSARAGAMITVPLATDRAMAELAGDPRLTSVAAALLGVEPVAFGATFFVKPARTGLPVLWHQDGHPWRARLGIGEAVTLWIALDAVDVCNGGLSVVPGSHSLPPQELRANPSDPSIFGVQIDPALVEAGKARHLALSPGDVSAHHSALVHGSGANTSPRPRRALALRYRPAPDPSAR
jgi:ectoine hydroxylase-related dioxygenase (phytanoyl-CoA dioxygenase family)